MPSTETISRTRSQGYLFSLLSAMVLSTTAIFIRYLTETYALPALVLAFWRDLFAVLTVLAVMALFRPALLKVSSRDLRYLAIYGLILASFNSFWTVSVAINGAAISTVLAYSSTAFAAFLGRWLLKEGLDWAKLLAVALTLGGCVLISGVLDLSAWEGSFGGILVGLGSGLFYAGYSLMGRAASQRGLNPWTTLLYSFIFATLFLFIFNLLPADMIPGAADRLADYLWLGDALAGWGLLFLLAAVPTVLGFGLYNISLTHLPSSIVNLIVTSELIFTTAQAYLLLDERLHAYELAGGLLILFGVVVLRWRENWREKRLPQAAV